MAETLGPVNMARVANSLPWMLVALILIYGSMGALGRNTTAGVLGLVGAALCMGVAWRSARLRLILADDVVIVGWFGRTTIPWSEVQRFDYNKKGLFIKQAGGLETSVPAFTMGASLLKSIQRSQEAEMQSLVERAERVRRQHIGRAPKTGKPAAGADKPVSTTKAAPETNKSAPSKPAPSKPAPGNKPTAGKRKGGRR